MIMWFLRWRKAHYLKCHELAAGEATRHPLRVTVANCLFKRSCSLVLIASWQLIVRLLQSAMLHAFSNKIINIDHTFIINFTITNESDSNGRGVAVVSDAG